MDPFEDNRLCRLLDSVKKEDTKLLTKLLQQLVKHMFIYYYLVLK